MLPVLPRYGLDRETHAAQVFVMFLGSAPSGCWGSFCLRGCLVQRRSGDFSNFVMMLFMTSRNGRLSQRFFICLWTVILCASGTARSQKKASEDPGQLALDHGDYAAAEAFYRRALLEHSASAELLTNLGIAMQTQGQSTEAIHAFRQALKLKKLPRTFALLAEERCKTRDLEGARPMLAEILKEDINDPQFLALVAPCYLDLDEPIESVEVYSALLSDTSFPNDLALIQLARSYLICTQFFIARLAAAPSSELYIQAIKSARDRGSPDARGAFALAAQNSPYFDASLSFDKAVRVWRSHPEDTALLYLLSVLSGEQSMRQVETCGDKHPNSPYLEQLRFEMLAEQEHVDEAIQGYERLLETHPELPELHYDLGMLYRSRHMWERAFEVFRAQLTHDPQDERSAARVSEALLELSRWNELRDFLEPRVKQKNPPLWAVLDLAETLQNLGDLQRAIQLLVSAEKENMSNKSIHFRLLLLYRKTGNLAQLHAEDQWLRSGAAKDLPPH